MFNELLNKLQTDSYLTLETTPTHEPTLEKIVSEIEKYDLATTPNNKPIISPIKISRLNRFIVIITF